MINKYWYSMSVHPENKWGGLETRKSLLGHWILFMLEHIADFIMTLQGIESLMWLVFSGLNNSPTYIR